MKYLSSTFVKWVAAFLAIAFISFTLSRYALLVQHLLRIRYSSIFEVCMVTGMLLFQLIFIYKKNRKLIFDYFANVLMVSVIGSLLLLPLIFINHVFPLSDLLNICYFFLVVLYMFFEHKKRVKAIGLPTYLSYTWILYRVIILAFIL
jgi:hypothetical protein